MAYSTPITRFYIDTRPFVPAKNGLSKQEINLPLLSTLPESTQSSILAFRRPEDKVMSLASQLLKNFFIHRTAKIPWNSITVTRTPKPHSRPYWSPPATWTSDFRLEFNVSHQAGMVALIGCKTLAPDVILTPLSTTTAFDYAQSEVEDILPDLDHSSESTTPISPTPTQLPTIRLGVDVACTNEHNRTPKNMATDADFDKWVDIFSEMFSDRERNDMKNQPLPAAFNSINSPNTASPTFAMQQPSYVKQQLKLRRFYTYWALKEAYIKMVGEGLLAPWLRELEFSDVVAPSSPVERSENLLFGEEVREGMKWTPTVDKLTSADFRVDLRRRRVEDGVVMELEAYDGDFIVATAMMGVREEKLKGAGLGVGGKLETGTEGGGGGLWTHWVSVDFEGMRDCAEGRCGCLAEK